MAVQAQYPSNALPPDLLRSWSQPGGVLEGVQMTQTRQNQMGHLLPSSLRKTMVVVDSGDQQQAVGLPNLSGSRKRLCNEPLNPQIVGFSNPPLVSAPAPAPIDLNASQSLRVFNSSATSTSGRQPMISHDLLAQICQHNSETDALIRFQNERLQSAVEELGKRHCRSLLSIFHQRVVKKLREKDIELENASRRNTELEEKINQVSAENQLWFNLARNNEAVASSLRRSLEQVLLENTIGAPSREGYGDSDDAQSCCIEDKGGWTSPPVTIRHQMVCKVCGGDDVCGLVLPCRHLCLCMDCETNIGVCPICNNPKKACLRIFIS